MIQARLLLPHHIPGQEAIKINREKIEGFPTIKIVGNLLIFKCPIFHKHENAYYGPCII